MNNNFTNSWFLRFKRYAAIVLSVMIIPVIVLACIGCDDDKSLSVDYFPVEKEPAKTSLLESFEGKIEYQDGYIIIKHKLFFWIKTYPVWPYGYSYQVNDGEVEVLDGNGVVVARTGSKSTFVGGETKTAAVSSSLVEPLPADYNSDGKIWIVSKVSLQ